MKLKINLKTTNMLLIFTDQILKYPTIILA